jgi:hypothetical protein
MSKNSAAHQKKVESAMQILQTTTGIKVPQAMILAGFSKLDIASKTVRQTVRRHRQQKQKARVGQPAPTNGIILISNEPLLLELTVVAEPTKRRKPKPPSFVDCCVPHHLPLPLLFSHCCRPHCYGPCLARHHPFFCHYCRHRWLCTQLASNSNSACASFVDGMGFVTLLTTPLS